MGSIYTRGQKIRTLGRVDGKRGRYLCAMLSNMSLVSPKMYQLLFYFFFHEEQFSMPRIKSRYELMIFQISQSCQIDDIVWLFAKKNDIR